MPRSSSPRFRPWVAANISSGSRLPHSIASSSTSSIMHRRRRHGKLISYFHPQFLLGTNSDLRPNSGATEETYWRCASRISVCPLRFLPEGIRSGLLAPFHYYGVPDESRLHQHPWRSSRVSARGSNRGRRDAAPRRKGALERFRKRAGKRALGFCVSQRHADFMADFFSRRGVPNRRSPRGNDVSAACCSH